MRFGLTLAASVIAASVFAPGCGEDAPPERRPNATDTLAVDTLAVDTLSETAPLPPEAPTMSRWVREYADYVDDYVAIIDEAVELEAKIEAGDLRLVKRFVDLSEEAFELQKRGMELDMEYQELKIDLDATDRAHFARLQRRLVDAHRRFDDDE
ncbi:MAG: hypothetical protein GF419_11900 [Ignavibacteriales bacterium]|nr:hypothetical protein [Ignavibacteriales bacterium]